MPRRPPPDGQRLELRIANACPCNCVFCCEWDNMRQPGPKFMPFANIINILYSKRKEGFAHVTFVGGEPTLHPDFEKIVYWTRRMGYVTQLSTNGLRFEVADYAKHTLPYLDEICISVHGVSPKSVFAATGVSQGHAFLTRALANIRRYGKNVYLICNFVVYPGNFDEAYKILPNILKFAKPDLYMVSNLIPWGRAAKNYSKLVLSLERMATLVPLLAEQARRCGLPVRFFGFPACIMGAHWPLSNDYCWSPSLLIEKYQTKSGLQQTRVRMTLVPPHRRVKPAKCRICLFNSWCAGVFNKYLSLFGTRELSAVRHVPPPCDMPARSIIGESAA